MQTVIRIAWSHIKPAIEPEHPALDQGLSLTQ
jgi:hypothetical protein